ncbi:MAG: sigma-70 family RNA polymerase sigma factor [Firmicutes bacterium]|nr:sigma-70 family RNA polymerase sigma factor [Bacillota bacterium]
MRAHEEDLLVRARRGDAEAFGQLIRPCLDRAYRLALRLLGQAEDAEDAVQDALYKAWRGLAGFQGRARFSTWLYRIVWRECLDRSRRRDEVRLAADVLDPGPDPHERLARTESRQEVQAALLRLPPPYRAVLVLFYLEDMPVKDIANILDLPEGTVKTHLYRARRALRAELDLNGDRMAGGGRER